uniref:C-type lectin domain-containing protein n=1 Tax=Laticauda laticaudata TaxID=8630 RepID=A0A8C5S740_LATLA
QSPGNKGADPQILVGEGEEGPSGGVVSPSALEGGPVSTQATASHAAALPPHDGRLCSAPALGPQLLLTAAEAGAPPGDPGLLSPTSQPRTREKRPSSAPTFPADLQASRQLQEASREHAAKSHVLGESIHRLQAGLEESRRLLRLSEQELNSTTVALWQSRAAENRTRRQLQHQELQANDSLALLRREQERLETNLSQATSCRQIGCCPRGWALFRWKCLWASSAWRTWEQSKADCERMSSRLLVLPEPWSAAELWKAVGETFSQRFSFLNSERFWVGLVKNREQDWTWKWVDGSLYKGETLYGPFYTSYGALGNGQLLSPSGKNRFICERAASPEDPALSDRLWRDL